MEWRQGVVRDIAEAFSGFAFQSSDLVDDGIPVLKIGNVQRGIVTSDVEDYYNGIITKRLEKFILRKDDFLIAMTGAGSVGRVGKMHNMSGLYLVNQRVAIVRPKQDDGGFLYYLMSMPYIENYLYSLGIGAGQPNISANDILNIKILIPPHATQQKISSILSVYDSLIENNQKRIKLLEQIAENLYKEWFVRFRFPGYERAEFEEGLPKGWKYESFGNLCPIKTGKKDANYSSPNGKYKFFTCSQDTLLADNYSFDCFAIILAGNGDFNVKVYDGKFEAYQRTYVLCPYDIKHLFISYYTIQRELIRLSSGAAGAVIKFLTKGMIERIKVVIPDSNTLEQFYHFSICNYRERQALLSKNEILIQQRDLLLPRLMSGKLSI